ncbi:MAG: hypothetical protein AAB893_00100 [Patescibacteria group bacterium]
METIYINILFAGFAGGIVRGIVGFIKHQFQFKNAIFKPKYFFGMMALSGIVGLLTALAVKGSGLSPRRYDKSGTCIHCRLCRWRLH